MCKTVMSGLGLIWILWMTGLAPAVSAAPETRMNVAVVEFSVMGDMHEQSGAIIADLMMSAIANSGRFNLKDRLSLSAVTKIAKAQDQELGYTGLLDPRTAADLGQRYGLDAVVIGAVSKPGDLITVTARLIDTKTASLLRSGQIQGQDIDTIQIKVNELAAMITTPPEAPSTYALTVRAEPADAKIRLLDDSSTYQPGIKLAPGRYEVEVAKEGYVARMIPVQIVDSALTIPVTLEKHPPPQYRLTVQADPPQATVRLLENKIPYQPGVTLPPDSYTVEISQSGYEAQQVTVQIVDSDVTLPVKLVKSPEPVKPAEYRLTMRPDPPTAKVKVLGVRAAYRPSMALKPGNYTVEVSQSGYETQRMTVRIADNDVTLPVKLVREPEPQQYQLTVRTEPSDAQVQLSGIRTAYRPGVALAPGRYTVQVSRSGYESQRVPVQIADSDVTVPVTLIKSPEPVKPTQYRLTVQTSPANARVRLVNSSFTYRPGVSLPPGSYTVEVSRRGYETRQTSVRIADSDVTESVTLEQTVSASTSATPPPQPATRPGTWRIGSVQVDSAISGADRSEVQRVLSRYVGQSATRDSLLEAAMQVYRSTGITLRFTVRNAVSGSAELSARVSQRLRRTHESSVPLVTRSQLESSGFGVSVE